MATTIEQGTFRYIGPCKCKRKAIVNGKMVEVCGGKLYETTPMKINGQVYPLGATVQQWCRSKHFKPERYKDASFM